MGSICDKSLIGERIKGERKIWGMTQDQLSEKLCDILGCDDISGGRISSYERGANYPTVQVLVALSEIFHVTTDYLLCRSDSKNPEAVEVVAYTGLTEEAASILNLIHKSDMATDSLGTELAKKQNRKKSHHINVCDIISDFIRVGQTCFDEMHMLKRLSFDMQKDYRPNASALEDKPNDLRMQANARRQANKYFGPSDIVCGKNLLIYRARRINDHIHGVVAQICDLAPAIDHCEKIDAQQRRKDFKLAAEWQEQHQKEAKPVVKESKQP